MQNRRRKRTIAVILLAIVTIAFVVALCVAVWAWGAQWAGSAPNIVFIGQTNVYPGV